MENMVITGKAWLFGDNIDTDIIIPARYLNSSSPDELAKHCMEDIDSDFSSKIQKGDIIVAGENFGCGSSREHAPVSIKACGISAVIAKSFARIFYRNAINIGLPIFEIANITDNTQLNDIIEANISTGVVKNLSGNLNFQAAPFPSSIQEIINAGGLVNYAKLKV